MANVKVSRRPGGDFLDVESGGAITLGASVAVTVSGTNVVITGLPTSDPAVAGALWSNSGVLTLSAG